jgi:hypothetical protein
VKEIRDRYKQIELELNISKELVIDISEELVIDINEKG